MNVEGDIESPSPILPILWRLDDVVGSKRRAAFSPDGLHRYWLARPCNGDQGWRPGMKTVGFGLLNPSKAGDSDPDPTAAKCVRLAHKLGYDWCVIVNPLTLVETYSKKLRGRVDPVGPNNWIYVKRAARVCDQVVVGWGNTGAQFPDEIDAFVEQLAGARLFCFGKNKNGSPKHPLYLKESSPTTFSWTL